MKLTLGKMVKHALLVARHRHAVMKNCAKCGIFARGLLHDLSKFSPEEFFESARHYQGNRSPIGACRRATGKSYAWLHHKGRNKHHIEYWIDDECAVNPLMPYKYAVECVCDKLAATKTYAKSSYTEDLPLRHWYKYGNKAKGNPRTMAFIEKVFIDIYTLGEKRVLNKAYMKKTYQEFCVSENPPKLEVIVFEDAKDNPVLHKS